MFAADYEGVLTVTDMIDVKHFSRWTPDTNGYVCESN